jgi:hypothetical protein
VPSSQPRCKVNRLAAKRDSVEMLVDGEEVSYEIKFPSEFTLADYEELQRIFEAMMYGN